MQQDIVNFLLSDSPFNNMVVGAALGAMAGVIGTLIGTLLSKIFKNQKLTSYTCIVLVVLSFQVHRAIIKPLLRNAGYEQMLTASEMLTVNTEAANTINSHAPMKVDEVTTLISAEGKNDGIYYNYRLAVPAEKLTQTADINNKLKQLLLKDLCKNHYTRTSLNAGDAFIYNYSDESGKFITSVTLKKSDCT